jgi:hypothetical protein
MLFLGIQIKLLQHLKHINIIRLIDIFGDPHNLNDIYLVSKYDFFFNDSESVDYLQLYPHHTVELSYLMKRCHIF